MSVSIHAPAQGATGGHHGGVGIRRFQSTPPRRGRLNRLGEQLRLFTVSIHAPAQGATHGEPGEQGHH